MLGRKKYRKGKRYMFSVGGVYSSGRYGSSQDRCFLTCNVLLLTASMDALDMFNEVMKFVRASNEVSTETPIFVNLYHVESN